MSDRDGGESTDTATGAGGTAKAAEQRRLSGLERWAAVALIAVFLVALLVLTVMRDDEQWDRLVFLFGSLEALVFAAAGALFGTSVQRQQTAAAVEEADEAKKEAAQSGKDAEAGRALRAAVKTKAESGAPMPASDLATEGAGPMWDAGAPSATGGSGDVDELSRLADELFD